MIARWPGVIAPGRSEAGLVSLTDIGATMVEVAGGEPLPSSDGHSLLACMQGTGAITRTMLYSEHGPLAPWNAVRPWNQASDDHEYEPPSRMVRRGTLKLYRYGEEPPVLHDLAVDPSETLDFWGDSKYTEVGVQLLQLLADGWVSPLGPFLSHCLSPFVCIRI
jgi:arylsulfatase A-like enzyme